MIEGAELPPLPAKLRIGLAGSGNLAWHWDRLFRSSGFEIDVHYHRSPLSESHWQQQPGTRYTVEPTDLLQTDWVFIALSDRAISDFARSFEEGTQLLIHGSGGRSIEALGNGRSAVFYLPQTFTLGRNLSYGGLTACIEARMPEDSGSLFEFASRLGLKALELNSASRARLHLAAVFANNYANLQFAVAERIMKEESLDKRLLIPLIEETARKAVELGAEAAQTGPARRGDLATVRKHLSMLKDIELKRMYRTLSDFLFSSSRELRRKARTPSKS